MKKEHLAHFNISGFTYYDGALVFQKLKVGTQLNMKIEPENKHDSHAVAIYYKDYKIGYVPRTENKLLYKLLKVGLKNNIQFVIQRVAKHEHPENQIQVVVHLVN
ncbi:MAG: HIRAN domain-containing protein [Bacteroidetes bacterium]|jgi:hypothetical protein|nr:HIRAN domain-containing protein [Bacteroidota bacterium]